MKVYAVCTYGKKGEDEEAVPVWDVIRLGPLYTSLDKAKARGEEEFRAGGKSGTPWVKEAVAWSPSRDSANTDRLALWSFLPAAAPRMDDPNRAFYPQARETGFWIETMELEE